MDIETDTLFQKVDPHQLSHFTNHHCLLEGNFSTQQGATSSVLLQLVDNTIFWLEGQQAVGCVQLTFDVKFEPLYWQEKDVHSGIVGIRLYNEANQEISFFAVEHQVSQWATVLSKRINIRGFHEMFKPIRKLGKGNFATVYEAKRLIDDQHFAVKAFSKQNSYSSKNGRESLINELSILRSLNASPHPNVLKLQAVYQSENSIYVVLQLLTGQTLFQKVQERRGEFKPEEIKFIIAGLLHGLAHMEKHRIAHRDLKPENIMLRKDSMEPVIVDFGLATNVDLPQYLFFRCGTPGYVSPEVIFQTTCKHVEPVVDVFSLGAVFHIFLAKKSLFEGVKYDEVYKNNKEFKMKVDQGSLKEADQDGSDLLRLMLLLDPSERIKPEIALQHRYFQCEVQGDGILQEAETTKEIKDLKMTSPVQTTAASSKKPKKKKNFLFF